VLDRQNGDALPPLAETGVRLAPGPSELRRGVTFSCAGALCSAIYLFPYKQAAAFASPDVLAFSLLCAAAVLNTALALARGSALALAGPRAWHVLLTTSALLALVTITGNYCGAQAVARLDPAITSVLLRTEVVFVGGMAALLLGERITPALGAGAALALAGLLAMRWPLALDAAGAGAAWALGAAASFALMQVLTRRVIHRISPTAVNAVRLWFAVALMAVLPDLVTGAVAAGARFWLFVGVAALFGPSLGRLCIMYSLRSLRAAHSALLLLSAPLFAFLIGYLGWGTQPSGQELAGGALMLLGIALPSLAALFERPARSDGDAVG
jgi:drug/metabolite transporter (DMT)-like permease